jgi:hypothetical protein
MDTPMDDETYDRPSIFKTAASSLQERRQLLRDLRFGLGLSLLLLCLTLGGDALGVQCLAWLLSLLSIWGLWRFDGEGLLSGYAKREIRIQDNALEIVDGRFTRLLFFDQLEQLRMIQSSDEKVLALELQTMDGALTLRGYENMEILFSILSDRKPSRVLLEVEELRFNRRSVGTWSRSIFGAGAVLMILFILVPPSTLLLKKMSGVLLLGLALFLAGLRPFSSHRGRNAMLIEMGVGFMLLILGVVLLVA